MNVARRVAIILHPYGQSVPRFHSVFASGRGLRLSPKVNNMDQPCEAKRSTILDGDFVTGGRELLAAVRAAHYSTPSCIRLGWPRFLKTPRRKKLCFKALVSSARSTAKFSRQSFRSRPRGAIKWGLGTRTGRGWSRGILYNRWRNDSIASRRSPQDGKDPARRVLISGKKVQ
jgi:hypothetical protein